MRERWEERKRAEERRVGKREERVEARGEGKGGIEESIFRDSKKTPRSPVRGKEIDEQERGGMTNK